MKRLAGGLAAVLASTLLAVVGSAGPAAATHVSCGQTITSRTILDSDVGPCNGNGIIIGADGVSLDLNGHRVFGTSAFGEGAGILVFRRTGVTISNGTVSGFDGGVVIEGGSGNTVRGITARDNIGFRSSATVGTLYGDGIAILSSQNNQILRNLAVNNGPFAGIGVYSDVDNDHPRQTTGVSSGNVLDGNSAIANVTTRAGVVNFASTEADGVRLELGSAGNLVINNQFSRNGLDGISLFARANNNILRNNVMDANGLRTTARRGNGINLFGSTLGNVIEGNRVTRNGDNGISVGGQNNQIRANVALQNAFLPPLNVNVPRFDLRDTNVNCDNNQWVTNTFNTRNMTCIN
jgi:parallel beta-helix repeat protein